MILHLLLLTMIVSWKPPPMGQVARAMDVSLVSGTGRMALAAFPFIALKPALIDPKPIAAAAKPSVAQDTSANLGSSLLLKPKPEPAPPKNVASILVDVISGGPSLTAQPLSFASHSTEAAPATAEMRGGESCQILENLKLGLQGSVAVTTALSLIPAKSLSVAKAIVLWNGHWIDASSVGGPAALAPIEQAVFQVVSQAPPICQGEGLQGVRFIILGDARDTTVLAFGSNEWRWADVIATLSPTILK